MLNQHQGGITPGTPAQNMAVAFWPTVEFCSAAGVYENVKQFYIFVLFSLYNIFGTSAVPEVNGQFRPVIQLKRNQNKSL